MIIGTKHQQWNEFSCGFGEVSWLFFLKNSNNGIGATENPKMILAGD